MNNPISFQREIGGRKLVIETGKLAGLAHSAVTVRYGDTVILVTANIAAEPRPGVDFLPLTIDYEERLYAAGKIPGGFIRREGRPSQEATLASRMTDRPLRPLLPKSWRRDIQIVNTVLSADQENDPDLLAVIGGSTVLTLSEIPFYGPVGAVRIGYIESRLMINPTLNQMADSLLDLVVVSTKDAVVMLETGAKEVPEELVLQAIEFGHQINQEIISLQEEMQKACGKPKVEAPPALAAKPEVLEAMMPIMGDRLNPILMEPDKTTREAAMGRLQKELLDGLSETIAKEDILTALDLQIKKELRTSILDKQQRPGGRGLNQIRPITCDVGLLPRTHGSALFTRGLTQVLSITTLGSKREEQQLDGLGIEETKRFIHHYNFPPFSTGEVGRVGSPGRREIGHGALAERALVPIIPGEEEFPYTIRLVSEVMSSNGSTSQASICASSMSLMDAGVPIKNLVAGVAMGLITDEAGRFKILTDIEGVEDNYGDMDCKVAGTVNGITAMQMDIKIKGVTMEMLKEAITLAKDARLSIMGLMGQAISAPRTEISPYAPRMYKIKINAEKIGAVIGTGGKTIRAIASDTDSTIDIEDDGTVIIGSPNEENAQKAIRIIEGLTKEAEVGQLYTGKVSRILNFGAMVEILPGKEGLVHISELADFRVAKVEDVVKIGDEVTVKVIGIDNMGRVNLSRRAVFVDASGSGNTGAPPPQQPRRDSRPPNRDRRPPPRR
ncbi:MAG: polyribonucleotide nucleotidyltransferase [Dehalococcoidales bacterium]|nr:polyribonucleotide nucleotidyltransferase [Dehalococcoidales bacterium]